MFLEKTKFFDPDAEFRIFGHVGFLTCPWVAGGRDLGWISKLSRDIFEREPFSACMGAYGRPKRFPSARFWGFGRILGLLRFADLGYLLEEWAGLGWAGLAGFS